MRIDVSDAAARPRDEVGAMEVIVLHVWGSFGPFLLGWWQRACRLRRALPVACALTLLASCAGDAVEGQAPELRWELPPDPEGGGPLVDFGEVPVGREVSQTIRFRNVGSAELVIVVGALAPPFLVEGSGELRLGVGQEGALGLGFLPSGGQGEVERAELLLQTNEEGFPEGRRVSLVGRGVELRLDCEPTTLEFGKVLVGASATRAARCANPLSLPLEVLPEIRGNHAPLFELGGAQERLVIPQHGTIELPITFRADRLGGSQASLVLRTREGETLASLPLRAEGVSSRLHFEPASCLDFGYVPVDGAASAELLLRNIGDEEVQILGIHLGGAGADRFRALVETPLVLAARSEHALEIEFRPDVGGEALASLEVRPREGVAASTCLSGFGGGPRLSCHPPSLEFGAVAVGMKKTRSFACRNDGYAPPGLTVDPLFVEAPHSDRSSFRPRIVNEDGSEGAKVTGYEIGKEFRLEVEWSPSEGGEEASTISVSGNDRAAPHQLSVVGEARALPPCEVSILPPRLRFGVVNPGSVASRSFSIHNELETACLIEGLHLSSGDPSLWGVEPIERLELEGGGRLEVEVLFQPVAEASALRGTIRFGVSDPGAPERLVELEGSAAWPCLLVDPSPIDFGQLGAGCSSREQRISIRNSCIRDVILQGVSLEGGGSSLEIIGRPTLPRTIATNDWIELQIRLQPEVAAPIRAGLVLEGEYRLASFLQVVPLLADAITETRRQVDRYAQPDAREVDILWVIDNSGSMQAHQERLATHLPSFISYADDHEIDYRIGVTTTGLAEAKLPCPGGVNGGEDGRLFPVDGSSPRILTPQTPNLLDHWRTNINVGICNEPEFTYEAARRALSSPLIDEEKDSRYRSPWQDGNAGFLREDAALSIILVTDETELCRDAFGRTYEDYVDFFRRVKGVRRGSRVRLHAIAGPTPEHPAPPGCSAKDGTDFYEGVKLTGGEYMSICTSSADHAAWEAGLRAISGAAFDFNTRFLLSSQPHAPGGGRPSEVDVEVRVDGQLVPPSSQGVRAWTYDARSNAVDFSPLYEPRAGAAIEISYLVGCG